MSTATSPSSGRWARGAVWLPGLVVALGAAVATAHGLYEVAVAARVPAAIAWIYPLITDGLALVAYAATARLRGSAARYAWSVVIVSAGLSGLAQAVYLASDAVAAGIALPVSSALRFGVGAWPAVAAAVVAHLLYLLAADHPAETTGAVQAEATVRPAGPDTPARLDVGSPPRMVLDGPVIPAPEAEVSGRNPAPRPVSRPSDGPGRAVPDTGAPAAGSPARDRARDAARRHRDCHGALPTVRELQSLADVSRGTAGDALKQLRDTPQQAATGLHLVPDEPETRTQQ